MYKFLGARQVGYSLLDRRPENGMAAYCAAHNISILPYGVAAGGLLSESYLGLPAGKLAVDTYSKGAASAQFIACCMFGVFVLLYRACRHAFAGI